MKEFVIFHVGDVHYPKIVESRHADIKDKGFDPKVQKKIAPTRVSIVMRDLADKIDQYKHDYALLFSGDLTEKGDETAYDDFVNKIVELFSNKITPDKIHVVPGNHDINRKLTSTSTQYLGMEKTWRKVHQTAQIIACNSIRKEKISVDVGTGSAVSIFSINTCMGCGGKRELVGEIKSDFLETGILRIKHGINRYAILKKVNSLLPRFLKDKKLKKSISPTESHEMDLYESLDTPAVDFDHLKKLKDGVLAGAYGKELPIVLAHHNLLPQYMPRIEIYTELINSGSMREHLLDTRRPILLCHGHIHDDPIEIITTPKNESKVILISAPEIINGYNIIFVYFGKKGYLLGCRIEHHRLKTGSTMSRELHFDIPFCQPSDYTSKGDKNIGEYLAHLEPGKPTRMCDLMTLIHKEEKNPKPNARTVANVLKEASWFGLVEIDNINEVDEKDWQVRKVFS